MKKSNWPIILMVALLGGGLLFGICRLFVLRFEAGDVYPPYSSLRTDPLGTKVLHDAMNEISGFSAGRNFQPLEKIQDRQKTTLFLAGASTDIWEYQAIESIEKLARDGTRIVIALMPASESPRPRRSTSVEKPAKKSTVTPGKASPSPSAKKSGRKKDEEETGYIGFDELGKRWKFSTANKDPEQPQAKSAIPDTEPALSWHTSLYFTKLGEAWRVVYQCKDRPVVIERKFGNGSIVISADSYFLSNEAMRAARAPRMLAWLAGAHSRMVFDETHLGVGEQPGIAALMWKYHLEGLLAAIMVLAGLFVWQTASPFLPPKSDTEAGGLVAGRDSAAGFVSLLRRGIAPSRLIEVCVEQWKKSFAHAPEKMGGVLTRIETAAAVGGSDPAGAYQTISRILAEKKYANHPR